MISCSSVSFASSLTAAAAIPGGNPPRRRADRLLPGAYLSWQVRQSALPAVVTFSSPVPATV